MSSLDPMQMAILAMDVYNRDPSQPNALTNAPGTVIGAAAILTDSSKMSGAQAAGFYAAAYQLPDGSIVISYRGTTSFATDGVNGWPVGAGNPYCPDAQLAIQFYQQVEAAHPDATISVTGHSLGGGASSRAQRRDPEVAGARLDGVVAALLAMTSAAPCAF